MSTEDRMRAFIAAGYLPAMKSHLLPGEPREGWATLYWREWMGQPDNPTFLSEPRADSVGWSIDAWPVTPKGQAIVGGVFATIEEALAYAEQELAKVLALRDGS